MRTNMLQVHFFASSAAPLLKRLTTTANWSAIQLLCQEYQMVFVKFVKFAVSMIRFLVYELLQ